MNIEIRKVFHTDIELLQYISKQTFLEAFAADNSEQDMNMYLSENLSIKQLTVELNTPGTEFFFALRANQVIGYLKINSGNSQTELHDLQAIEIERIYVLKEFQRKSIGQALFEIAVHKALQIHATCIWLGVWEHNTKAINFYKKNGFVEFGKHNFLLGTDNQTDIMMKRLV